LRVFSVFRCISTIAKSDY